MDNFRQLLGTAEGCNSSESGWTMYIGSSTKEDDSGRSYEYDDDIHVENWRQKKQESKVGDAESDDSMASDASSGQIHNHHSQSNHGKADSKRYKKIQGSKCSSQKNASEPEKKRVDSRSKRK